MLDVCFQAYEIQSEYQFSFYLNFYISLRFYDNKEIVYIVFWFWHLQTKNQYKKAAVGINNRRFSNVLLLTKQFVSIFNYEPVLFNNITNIIRFPGLLELPSCNKIFNFSNGSNSVFVGFCQSENVIMKMLGFNSINVALLCYSGEFTIKIIDVITCGLCDGAGLTCENGSFWTFPFPTTNSVRCPCGISFILKIKMSSQKSQMH